MSRLFRRILIGFLSLILVLAIILTALSVFTVRRSFPQTQGEIRISGLSAPVDIYRDAHGIPQIYAQTRHDLFFAQGYVHAQDRFWQMDFWRHIGSGRLSEMFGASQLETDQFLRTLGWARVADQELQALDPDTRSILQAYSDGVNAYLAGHQGSALSLEYAVLGLTNRGYKIEPWQPLNTLTWAKVMAWDLRGNLDEEITRSILLKKLTLEQVSQLYPPYQADHPTIIPDSGTNENSRGGGQVAADILPLEQTIFQRVHLLESILGPSGKGIGSNNWVISGSRTATGKPFLANDPHLGEQMPSIWYEIGLHCAPKTQECSFEVTGFSFPGAPAVIVGHNDRIAWGVTNVGPDVMDLYIEKVNPANPDQYEVNGKWVDMQIVHENIQVAGGSPVDLTVRYTRHGPIISDTYASLKKFSQQAGISLPQTYALALRWTALEPTNLFQAIWRFDTAQNWDDFRSGAQDFSVPAQNLVYADVDGNIGYQMPGKIPMRAKGDGRLPVPGWTDEYEWTGYIPFDQLPRTFNPPQGYIVTANNAVVGPSYPHLITTDWDYGYRAMRITELIEKAPGPVDIAYLQKMQGDDKDLIAQTIVPYLSKIPLEDPHLKSAQELLQNWDYQNQMDSAPAALFAVFWRDLLKDTFDDELPPDFRLDGDSRSFAIIENLMNQPNSVWWDNQTTPEKENRDQIFSQAFGEAVDELSKLQGSDPSRWNWGSLHTVIFHNQTFGESGIGVIEALFNRGPFRAAGGGSIVNATAWDASAQDQPYQVAWLPSMRMLVDLSNLDNSLAIHTTGESGHAYHPHYVDMADMWRNIQYLPMLWDRSQVEKSAVERLVLRP